MREESTFTRFCKTCSIPQMYFMLVVRSSHVFVLLVIVLEIHLHQITQYG